MAVTLIAPDGTVFRTGNHWKVCKRCKNEFYCSFKKSPLTEDGCKFCNEKGEVDQEALLKWYDE